MAPNVGSNAITGRTRVGNVEEQNKAMDCVFRIRRRFFGARCGGETGTHSDRWGRVEERARSGIGTELLRFELARWAGAHFLEVRESNTPARELYRRLGFEIVGSRPGYYDNPPETGIVMRIFS